MLEFLKKIDRALFPDLLVLAVARETRGSASVLDGGCGDGGPMARVPQPARVHGVGGPKWLRGQFAELRFWPKPVWHRISGFLQPFTWIFPRAAFGLVAVKELKP